MTQPGSTSPDATRYLVSWMSLLAAALLVVAFMYFDPLVSDSNHFGKLLLASAPEALVVLVGVAIGYVIFERRGIDLHASRLDTARLVEEIAGRIGGDRSQVQPSQVVSFYDTWLSVPWGSLIDDAHTHIDIVVYYFDSWVTSNSQALERFFRRPGTSIRIFVPDPLNDAVIREVHRLFPEHSPSRLSEKVSLTGVRFASILREAGASSDRLQSYTVPRPLTYSAQCIDNRYLILGFFEMYRNQRIGSPIIVLDLHRSEELTRYWRKELAGLLNESSRAATEEHNGFS